MSLPASTMARLISSRLREKSTIGREMKPSGSGACRVPMKQSVDMLGWKSSRRRIDAGALFTMLALESTATFIVVEMM